MIKEKTKKNASCNQVILDHFWQICEASEEKRCRSVQVILQTLQAQVNKTEERNDIRYCLERLVKGLASAREFARHGFCVLLTRLLAQFPEHLDLSEVLDLAEKEFGGGEKTKKLENLDSEHIIAWTLLLSCVVKCERLQSSDDPALLTRIWSVSWRLGMSKPYVEIIITNIIDMLYDVFADNQQLFEQIVMSFIDNNLEEGKNMIFLTYTLLLARKKYPKSSAKESVTRFLDSHLYKLKSKDYKNVFKLIRETTKYAPNIHPLVAILLETLIQLEPANVKALCSGVVDQIFQINLEKSLLGFEVVKILLKLIPNPEMVPLIVSSPFVTVFIQTCSNKKHPLHNAALELGNHLAQYSQEHVQQPQLQLALARSLISKPGSINFDELTHSKILVNITKHFTDDSIKAWVTMLKDLMLQQQSIPASDFYRVQCLQQLVHLLKSYTLNDDFLASINRFLFVYAYLDRSMIAKSLKIDKFEHPVSQRLQSLFANDFKTLFAHQLQLASMSGSNPAERVAAQVAFVSKFVYFIGKEVLSTDVKFIDNQIDKNKFLQTWKRLERDLQTTPASANIQANIFKLLALCFMVEMFENLDEIAQMVPDFEECARRALINTEEQTESKIKNEEELAWADVLTELLLSQLTTKSKYMRTIINLTFKQICSHLTPVGVGTLIDAFANEKDVLDSDAEDEEDDEHMQVKEEDDQDDGDEDDGDDDEDDDDDDEDVEDDDNEEVDEQFKQNVIKALGKAADIVEKEEDDEDEEDDNVSDSEMFKLDESLAQIFRAKFGNKKAKAEKDTLVQTFKLRVLDLIGVLLDHNKQLRVELLAELAEAVVRLARANFALKDRAPLMNKCCATLMQISKYKLDGDNNNEKVSLSMARQLFTLLMSLQNNKHLSSEVSKSLAHITSWLVSRSGQDMAEQCQETLTLLLDAYLNNSNHLSLELFNRIIPQVNRMSNTPFVKSTFYKTLIEHAFREDIRAFQRGSALIILHANITKDMDTADLAYRLDKQIIVELGKAASKKSKKKIDLDGGDNNNNNVLHIPYLTHLIKLWLAIDGQRWSDVKLFREKLNNVTRDVKKRLDKRFVKKLKSQ